MGDPVDDASTTKPKHDLAKIKAVALAKIKKVTPELVEAVMALFFACDDATDEASSP